MGKVGDWTLWPYLAPPALAPAPNDPRRMAASCQFRGRGSLGGKNFAVATCDTRCADIKPSFTSRLHRGAIVEASLQLRCQDLSDGLVGTCGDVASCVAHNLYICNIYYFRGCMYSRAIKETVAGLIVLNIRNSSRSMRRGGKS